MGNATQKLAPEDISALNGMEDVTGMDRKELMKEYKKFKKQYPTGGISKEAFRKVRMMCLYSETDRFVECELTNFVSRRCSLQISFCHRNSAQAISSIGYLMLSMRTSQEKSILGSF